MNNKLLEIKNLTIHYDTEDATVHALNHLSFSLEAGKTLGFVGETGAGKTTTAKAIMRILPHPPAKIVQGEILFEGQDLLKKSIKEMQSIRGKEISMIFQDPMTSINPVLQVVDQVAEVIQLHQTTNKREAYNLAADILEMVGIKRDRIEEYPHQFSGGMKQRVIIAMALACRPKLLIADEPTSALDVTIQAQVLELMKSIKVKFNSSMIMITHDLGIVAEICDYVAVIYAGHIVEYGTREQLFTNACHPYTKGLFGCIPDLTRVEAELVPIVGLMPDPSNLPVGCAFHPRCPNAMEKCGKGCLGDDVEYAIRSVEVEPNHFVSCLLYGNDGGALV